MEQRSSFMNISDLFNPPNLLASIVSPSGVNVGLPEDSSTINPLSLMTLPNASKMRGRDFSVNNNFVFIVEVTGLEPAASKTPDPKSGRLPFTDYTSN